MRRKNQIFKYYASRSVDIMKKIRNQSIKNILTQKHIEEENQQICKCD